MNRPEILAPAGSLAAMEAAVKAGADAIYMGGTMFGARAYADNPKEDELVEAIHYVHFYNKKLYLTLNTLLKEEELDLVGDYLKPYYEAGLDGIIIQDPGVFSFVKNNFPGLALHASTQMNITGLASAKLLKEAGASRIVPARELSLAEISRIKEETGLEIETFVHGALCYCYSGRCLMSSILGGRSGNRGRCAQPCRLPYEVNGNKKTPYVLSPKDLCTISLIPELTRAGIDSFKIEGRMKNPEYVASIVSVYRKYLDKFLQNPDKPYKVAEEDFQLLLEAYNRGGFTDGYYKNHNGPDMMSMERPNHRGIEAGKIEKVKDGQIFFHPGVDIHKGDLLEIEITDGESIALTSPSDCKKGKNFTLKGRKTGKLRNGQIILRTGNSWQKKQLADTILTPVKKRTINGKAEFIIGQPARLTLETDGNSYTQEGDMVLLAEGKPLTKEQVAKPLTQTGTSRFDFDTLSIELEEGAFLPMGAVKKLRREGLAAFQTILEKKEERKFPDCNRWTRQQPDKKKTNVHETDIPKLRVSFEDIEKVSWVIHCPEIEGIYLPLEDTSKDSRREILEKARAKDKKVYYALPRVFRNPQQQEYDRLWTEFEEEKPDGYLIRNLDELAWIREKNPKDCEVILDHSIYAYNSEAVHVYDRILDREYTATLPLELNKKELSKVDYGKTEMVVYGRIPLMVSSQCVTKNTKGCVKSPGYLTMTDRYQKKFYVRRHCRYCYNTVWNGVPLSLHGLQKELSGFSPSSLRFHVTVEKESEIKKMIQLFYDEWNHLSLSSEMRGEFTRGHYKRGVE